MNGEEGRGSKFLSIDDDRGGDLCELGWQMRNLGFLADCSGICVIGAMEICVICAMRICVICAMGICVICAMWFCVYWDD